MFRTAGTNRARKRIGSALLLTVITATATTLATADIVLSDGFELPTLPNIPDSAQPTSDRHTAHPLGSTDAGQGFYEYLPAGYSTSQHYPLLIFVHGLGENGDGDGQLSRVLRNGPPKLIENDRWDKELPFVVLSPQHSGGGCTSSSEIAALIEFATGNYSINASRIYLTGLSCGAIGSWNYAGQHINSRIAAMVPIAGNGNGAFNRAGCALGALPIWAFHGDSDGTVNAGGTTGPVNNLLACDPGPVDVRMTIYPGVGHNSWSRTYDLSAGHDIYQWMLGHTRP